MISASITIENVDVRRPECSDLISKLTAELALRYGDDGAAGFHENDVLTPRSSFVLLKIGNLPIGCGALRLIEQDTAEIKRMYVLPDYRRQGFSRLILARLEELARGFEYRRIWLETGLEQPEALNLYRKAGYTEIANFGYYKNDLRSVSFEKIL